VASIERHGNLFRVVFRYLGQKYRITLKTDRPREAEGAGSRVEETMRLVKLGTIDPPPDGIDIGQFMLSGGRRQVPRGVSMPEMTGQRSRPSENCSRPTRSIFPAGRRRRAPD
jgi:hypothetical protein